MLIIAVFLIWNEVGVVVEVQIFDEDLNKLLRITKKDFILSIHPRWTWFHGINIVTYYTWTDSE